MALYEAVFISRQDLTAQGVDDLSDKLSEIITKADGKILKKEYWGLRDLAYKINKNPRGHYVALTVESGIEAINELKRVASINEDIVRDNIFKIEEFIKEPSELKVSENAKDYKPNEASDFAKSEDRKAFDAKVQKIVINS